MASELIAEAITDYFGERCLDYAEGCPTCEAWAEYDRWNTRTAPADGLERYRPEPVSLGGMVRDPDGGYVTRSQAEELLAAERDKVLFLKTAMEIAQTHCGLKDKTIDKLEADNAAKAARIKELDRCHEGTIDLCNQKTAQIEALEAKLAAAEKALEPFADHAKERAVDAPEWRDTDTVRIVVTIGDLRKARAVLGGKPS